MTSAGLFVMVRGPDVVLWLYICRDTILEETDGTTMIVSKSFGDDLDPLRLDSCPYGTAPFDGSVAQILCSHDGMDSSDFVPCLCYELMILG
ncbi:hypothetical protein QQP08_012540 [Theobroma cacao]|nr:hypothetical protein QQP08_012540 [Theobroma cacao]